MADNMEILAAGLYPGLAADNVRLRKALEQMERAASEVHRLGAVRGSQWVGLSSALILARSALRDGEG